jgi:hypothetical protein
VVKGWAKPCKKKEGKRAETSKEGMPPKTEKTHQNSVAKAQTTKKPPTRQGTPNQ